MMAWLNPTRWLMLAALAGALWLGYHAFVKHQQQIGYDRAVAEYDQQAKAIDAKREVITKVVERDVVRVVHDIAVVTETITKEVPTYVPTDSCALPGGWRLLHDAAASSEVPDPARIADAEPVPADIAANTVIANYGACNQTAANLKGLQQWVSEQQALH